MVDRATRRQRAVEDVARHLLEVGLKGASLRPMAAAAGVSDRMLLYYFDNRNDLLTAALGEVVGRMLPVLESSIDDIPKSPDDLLAAVIAAVSHPDLNPFMQLWLELAAGAGRKEQPYLAIAGQIADGFLLWIESRLNLAPGPARRTVATRLLVLVEGAAVLRAVGRGDEATAAVMANGLGQ